MPKNPIVDAILEAGKKAVESARRTFRGEFHTGHLSTEHVHLPNDRQRPRLLTPEELRRREQVRAAEDQAVFDALDGIAANPRRRLTPQDLLGMTPEQRNEAVVTQAALDIQDDIDADILRTLEAQSLASPGLIPGTVNIQAPLQVSHIVPNPNSLYDAVPQAQVGMLQALTREDIDRFRREIEQYDLQVTPPPIGIPGRMEGELAVDRVNVDRENLFRLFQQGNLSVDTIQEMFNLDVPPEPSASSSRPSRWRPTRPCRSQRSAPGDSTSLTATATRITRTTRRTSPRLPCARSLTATKDRARPSGRKSQATS